MYIYISICIYIYIRQRYFSRSPAARALWSIGGPLLQAADEEGSEAYGAGNEGSYTSGSSEIFFMCFFSHQKVGGCVSKSKIDKFIN